MAIRAVISDFGGVLTTPLLGSFAAFQNRTGILDTWKSSQIDLIARF